VQFLKPDSWSGWHLWGSFFLVHFLQIFPHESIWTPALIVFGLGVAYDFIGDEICGKCFEIGWFDVRGFDWGDVCFDALGCGLALWI
jgi:hypothetical protein